ncbi:MAG: 2-C-methyl-D-erythritol 4-phosphate cytidylyltransferase [Bacteroidales bacterium]|nr:2-C-methyl-D-erythritol 4-phosphate cytidylyltransferase [Bacteroidales bacterium]
MVVAVLLAGGSGSRMGSDRPKQFLKVKGKTILEWTIEAFHRNPLVDEIAIVSRADSMEEVAALARPYPKVRRILQGGKERYDSSLAAIHAYEDDECRILLHDAVRPLVSQRIITDCIHALDRFQAVDVAVPSTDTIVEVDENGVICRIPQRASLRNVQTPQGFLRGTIRRAYEVALSDPNFQTTDDCGVVFRYLPEIPIGVVEGDMRNIKITYPQDLLLMEEKQ